MPSGMVIGEVWEKRMVDWGLAGKEAELSISAK